MVEISTSESASTAQAGVSNRIEDDTLRKVIFLPDYPVCLSYRPPKRAGESHPKIFADEDG